MGNSNIICNHNSNMCSFGATQAHAVSSLIAKLSYQKMETYQTKDGRYLTIDKRGTRYYMECHKSVGLHGEDIYHSHIENFYK